MQRCVAWTDVFSSSIPAHDARVQKETRRQRLSRSKMRWRQNEIVSREPCVVSPFDMEHQRVDAAAAFRV